MGMLARKKLMLMLYYGLFMIISFATILTASLDLNQDQKSFLAGIRKSRAYQSKPSTKLHVYPDKNVIKSSMDLLVVCEFDFDVNDGYVIKSIRLNDGTTNSYYELQVGAPKKQLNNFEEQSNIDNYHVVDKYNDILFNPIANTVKGKIDKNGLGIFLVNPDKNRHLSCAAVAQNLLPVDKRESLDTKNDRITEQLAIKVFSQGIGQPTIKNKIGDFIECNFNSQINIKCAVQNSEPKSKFHLILAFIRNDGQHDILERKTVHDNEARTSIQWRGEKAYLSLRGTKVKCSIENGWGLHLKPDSAFLVMNYMLPAYVINYKYPNNKLKSQRKTLAKIGDYITCIAEGHPLPVISWVYPSKAFSNFSQMLVVTNKVNENMYKVKCVAESEKLKLRDEVEIFVKISATSVRAIWYLVVACTVFISFSARDISMQLL